MVKKLIMVFAILAFVLPAVVYSQSKKTVVVPKAQVRKIKPVSPQPVDITMLKCKKATILCNCYFAGMNEWRTELLEGIAVERFTGSTCISFADIDDRFSNLATWICRILWTDTANTCVAEWDCDERC